MTDDWFSEGNIIQLMTGSKGNSIQLLPGYDGNTTVCSGLKYFGETCV